MQNMRDEFGKALVELATIRDDFVVLDADVAGGTGTYHFRKAYPDRFIQCGIAEQNMFSMAAGLAESGIIPIVTCYAVFASMRALEQARNSIAYPDFNVKIAASHLGLDVGPDGATHQALEDISIYRAIPNMTVVSLPILLSFGQYCLICWTATARYTCAPDAAPCPMYLMRTQNLNRAKPKCWWKAKTAPSWL